MSIIKISDGLEYINGNFPNKKAIHKMAEESIDDIVDSGETNLIQLNIQIKRMLEFLTEADRKLKPYVLDEFQNDGYSQGEIVNGAKVEQAETGVKYDYSHSPEYNKLKNELLKKQQEIKAKELHLRTLPEGAKITEVDLETGDVVEVGPAAKSSTTIVKITL